MDTFSPALVSNVSTRVRRLALSSAAVLAACTTLVAVSITSEARGDDASGAMVQTTSASLTAEQYNLPADQTSSIFSPLPVTVSPSSTPQGVSPGLFSDTPAQPSTPRDAAPNAARASVQWNPSASSSLVSSGLNEYGRILMTPNRTIEVKTKKPVKRVSVGSPEIADVQPFADNLLLVTAKKAGSTQVIVWDENNQSQSIDVNVEVPLDELKNMIGKLAPGSNIEVSVANGTIILRGQAPNLTVAKQVGDVAGAFGKTQNFIEVAGGQTVAVQVQFAEVSRSVTNSLGVNWGFSDGTAIFGSQPAGNGPLGFHVTDGVIDDIALAASPGSADIFGRIISGRAVFGYFIKALRENNLLRVLQEPTLTTTSGEPASFLAGGQVAVPVPTENGTVGIEYKEFGVRLLLTPIVLGNGKIRLIMEAESSDLDYANGTTIQSARVPGLRTRRVQSSVEMGEGQTMSVAGLLDDSVIATRSSIPGLGDIPVLGQLFRSTRYQRKETELVILITPRLSGAMNPDQVTALPGANWRHPNELEQAFLGDMGGNAEADATRDFLQPESRRGLKEGDRVPATSGNPLAAAGETSDTTTAQAAPPPMFLGTHGFVHVPQAGSENASASVKE